MPIDGISRELLFYIAYIKRTFKETVSMIRAKVKPYCRTDIANFECPVPIFKNLWVWLVVIRTDYGSYSHGMTIVA